ncbi:MAG: ABC transporter ATP-binding protein/permease [Mollicutes bacterium]|nr:ABC transporter ATP-binding protein/permease [Mollicutes bacterium]MDD7264565.1 ABC transporter ATP-binding protein [bacterium]MDY4979296.1 ABC transporter ATP-binding protein [Candidatus Onthovivens sp.]
MIKDSLGNYSFKHVIKTLLKSVREYKKETILSIILIGLETLFECIIPFTMSKLLDNMQDMMEKASTVNKNEYLYLVLIYGAILLVLATLSFICGINAGRLSAKASVGFECNLRKDLFYNISNFSFDNIDKFSASSLVTRQTIDAFYIQMAFMMCTRIGLRAPLMLIFSITMAIIQSPGMSWIYAITIPFLAAILLTIVIKVMPIFNKVFVKYDDLNESVEENVRGIRVVKTYVREEYEKQKFNKTSEDVAKGFVKAERIIALSNPTMMTSMYISMILILTIGSISILYGKFGNIKVGQISSLITYGAQILSSLMMLQMVFVMFSMSVASMGRVYEVLIEEPTIKNCENPIKEVSSGDILFKNVSFKYKKDAEKYALSDVNLEIKNGQTVGIIGGTGSSKSTVVNLISRFYDTTEGDVEVGGINVKDYDIKTLRENVSMVLQNNILFSGTINENLRWGNNNATDEEIVEACKIAQADTFIESFPDKYNTLIYQGGTNVSGGQKQRLCIARAILKKPKILIMDDSTSAVDTKTDAFIREGLKKTLPNTTKIIIAQRISSVQNCDFIVVMDDGKINGIGNHDELLKSNEIYKEIYNLQNNK